MSFFFMSLVILSSSLLLLASHHGFFHLDKFYDMNILIRCTSLLLLLFASLFAIIYYYLITCPKKKQIYLLDFACYKANPTCMCTKEMFMNVMKSTGKFTNESLDFQKKILERSGFGEGTYAPTSLLKTPPNVCLAEARKETESVVIGAIDELLSRTKVRAEEIGIVVTNCCVFNPTPSLSAMVVNHYKLRDNVVSYNLSGMGCSAGLISIELAKQLLQVRPNSYALIVSTENINGGLYFGNNRSMLVSNCLFRMGGAAILLSNLNSDSHRSKYCLKHIVRTHKGSQNHCYDSIIQEEDDDNITGVTLSKNIMSSAGQTLKANISTLGKYVLPFSEQLRFVTNFVAKKLFFKVRVIKSFTPNFMLAFEHFCIHTGGKAVQDEMQKVLGLSDWHMEPSRMTLYRYGNTSSSSVWYELAYCEAQGRVKKGDRIWQIAFGSGFKCNSVVWCALRTIDPTKEKNLWSEFSTHVTN